MGAGPAKLLGGDDLVGDGLDHVWAGHEHVGSVLHHEDEIGHRGRIDRPARAGAHDDADLRDDARRLDVALEDFGIACKARHPFLDTRAARIVDADHRGAVLHGHIHDLADLLSMGFRQRAAEDGEILTEDIDETPVDRAPSGHHPVTCGLLLFHPEVGAAMGDEHVEFLEAAFVQQQVDPFARRQLAALVLGVDPRLTTPHTRLRAAVLKLCQNVLHRTPLLSHPFISAHSTQGRGRAKGDTCKFAKTFHCYLRIMQISKVSSRRMDKAARSAYLHMHE